MRLPHPEWGVALVLLLVIAQGPGAREVYQTAHAAWREWRCSVQLTPETSFAGLETIAEERSCHRISIVKEKRVW